MISRAVIIYNREKDLDRRLSSAKAENVNDHAGFFIIRLLFAQKNPPRLEIMIIIIINQAPIQTYIIIICCDNSFSIINFVALFPATNTHTPF